MILLQEPISFTSSEMWIIGIFISVIMALVGAIATLYAHQTKTMMSGIRGDFGIMREDFAQLMKIVGEHDKSIERLKTDQEYLNKDRAQKLDEFEELKKHSRETRDLILSKLRAMTP